MGSARISLGCIALMLSGVAAPAEATASDAEIADEWDFFAEGLDFGEDPQWSLLGNGYSMDLGTIEEALWTLAWRRDELAGVYLRYRYAAAVSPPELPGTGPMQVEEVEATFDCAAHTVRLHHMYLFRPDGSYIGNWFDPDASARPGSFDDGSIMGQAFRKVC
jgi:hypothetical protein